MILKPGEHYGLRLTQQFSNYRVFIDGVLLKEVGRVANTKATSMMSNRVSVVNFVAAKAETELVLQVSNYELSCGGLRGSLKIARSNTMQKYALGRKVFEVFIMGFLFTVFLYHLNFFITQAREVSYLYFAILCLSFTLRIPFWGEKIFNEIFTASGWEWQLRFLTTLNLFSPAMLFLFLRSVFPDVVSKRTIWIYAGLSFVFMLTQFASLKVLNRAVFVFYLIIFAPFLLHALYVTLLKAWRGNTAARIMSFGMLPFACLGIFAMLGNWLSISQPAIYAYSGFAIFSFFQSIAIGRNYQESIKMRQNLSLRLEHSKAALDQQRRELELNLHDSLGGSLTDLKILIERSIEESHQAAFNKYFSGQQLVKILARVDAINYQLREQLLLIEDLELTIKDPVVGLHMQLLRRYSNAERELDFQLSARAQPALEHYIYDDRLRMDFVQLVRELCTNDLKYGKGDSHWNLYVSDDIRHLVVSQCNQVDDSNKESADHMPENRSSIGRRAEKIGGIIQIDYSEHISKVQVRLPL